MNFVWFLIGFLVLGPGFGCVRGGPGPVGLAAHVVQPPRPSDGPYRDIDSAVRFVMAEFDMAIIEADASDPSHWRYELITTRDEPVTLDILFPADMTPDAPAQPTEITARIGRFGDPSRERAFEREIASRLKAVRKTGVAPGPDAG